MIRINGNQFIDNSAAIGGGISSGLLQNQLAVYKNTFENNNASRAAGLALFNGENTISKNTFQNHQGQETIFLAVFQGTFESNTIVGNNTNVGLYVPFGSPPFPRFSNNIVARSGANAILALGSQQSPLFAELEHNTLVGGGGGAAVSIPVNSYVTLSLTNNIIANFPVGVENSAPATSTVNARHTLFAPDIITQGVNINFQNSLVGNPAFNNMAADDYHIKLTSAAKDAGASSFIADQDIDGDPRPIRCGPDIGADEFSPFFLYLPLITLVQNRILKK